MFSQRASIEVSRCFVSSICSTLQSRDLLRHTYGISIVTVAFYIYSRLYNQVSASTNFKYLPSFYRIDISSMQGTADSPSGRKFLCQDLLQGQYKRRVYLLFARRQTLFCTNLEVNLDKEIFGQSLTSAVPCIQEVSMSQNLGRGKWAGTADLVI